MISDAEGFLRYFDAVHRRTVRDVSALPEEAESWTPPAGEEEAAWGAEQIVRHLAEARGFFASAYLGKGWRWEPWDEALDGRDSWPVALERSAERFRTAVEGSDPGLLRRKLDLIGGGGAVSGWRVLMMLVEHEVHHRSQLVTYAGLNGWPVNQLFGRSNEWVVGQLQIERERRS